MQPASGPCPFIFAAQSRAVSSVASMQLTILAMCSSSWISATLGDMGVDPRRRMPRASATMLDAAASLSSTACSCTAACSSVTLEAVWISPCTKRGIGGDVAVTAVGLARSAFRQRRGASGVGVVAPPAVLPAVPLAALPAALPVAPAALHGPGAEAAYPCRFNRLGERSVASSAPDGGDTR